VTTRPEPDGLANLINTTHSPSEAPHRLKAEAAASGDTAARGKEAVDAAQSPRQLKGGNRPPIRGSPLAGQDCAPVLEVFPPRREGHSSLPPYTPSSSQACTLRAMHCRRDLVPDRREAGHPSTPGSGPSVQVAPCLGRGREKL